MTFVAARCPQCGGELQLDNEKETGFCMHCGSKIVVREAIRAVRIDNTHMVETWMKMGDLAADSGNLPEAYAYYTKIIEAQPDNCWAFYKKGKAAGWQSTLSNMRIIETVVCFAQAIDLAPEDEKEKIKDDSTEEIKGLATALISLRADRFIKWPDEDEANGFLSDINTIYSAVVQLANKSGVVVSGYMEPIAARINSAVIVAWSEKIKPDYLGDENRPGKYEFNQFIERIGFCTMLVEKAIDLSDEDDEEDIQRYENLIFLHTEAIESCSWDYEIEEWGKEWHIEYQLTDSAKQSRKNTISEYNTKISQIKNKKRQQEEAEGQEEERKAIESAQKIFDEYWAAHTTEKAHLESKKNGLSDQIISLEKEKDAVTSPMLKKNENIRTKITQLREEQKTLGLFKGTEKKALQEQIDYGQNYLAANTAKLNEAQNSIIAKIEGLKKRINEINNELTKAR